MTISKASVIYKIDKLKRSLFIRTLSICDSSNTIHKTQVFTKTSELAKTSQSSSSFS